MAATASTFAALHALGELTQAEIDDSAAPERFWCGLRTEDGCYCSGTGHTPEQAARACLTASTRLP